MTELKTLNDMPFDETHFIIEQTMEGNILGIEELYKNAVSKIDLREEAIKEIKAIREMKRTFHDNLYEILTGNKLKYSEEVK